ncbi:MAG: methyltransferase regulatory domain-containing protein [Betaproteobacteria bacterium]|nr:methyltransferase regulatory domain-containing protein [Betaproteobacteria bacterium]
MNNRTTADLAEKYDTVAYVGQPNPLTHPAHLATVATLFGLAPPSVDTCRVLEVGCGDGANLLPMAMALPHARFVGCDIAPRAIEAARAVAAELGLANATLLTEDLTSLPAHVGDFDYIIAHGLYSWVPALVRDALFTLAAQRLSINGVLFVSYNAYPGCHIRRAAWDILHFHTDAIVDAQAQIKAARTLAGLLAEPGATHEASDALLREEFRRIESRSDSALFHDDMGSPNDPIYFHEFIAHAQRFGLDFLAEASLPMMSVGGLSANMSRFVAGMGRLVREQYIDFARMRRFRQTLLCRAAPSTTGIVITAIAKMYVSAATPLIRSSLAGKDPGAALNAEGSGGEQSTHEVATLRELLRWLVAQSPRAAPVAEVKAWYRARTPPAQPEIETILAEACMRGLVQLHVDAPAATFLADEFPVASPMARWQASRQEQITNLRHESLRLPDAAARRLLALLDGSRSRVALHTTMAVEWPESRVDEIRQRIDDYLGHFAKLALLS